VGESGKMTEANTRVVTMARRRSTEEERDVVHGMIIDVEAEMVD
jgi:hypothetical protein